MPMKTVTLYRWQVAMAFLLVTAAFVIASIVLSHETHKVSRLTNANKDAIQRIQKLEKETLEFRKARLKKTTESDVLICQRVEALKTLIRSVVVPTIASLRRVTYYQEHPEEIAPAIRAGKKVAARFGPKNCQALPTAAK